MWIAKRMSLRFLRILMIDDDDDADVKCDDNDEAKTIRKKKRDVDEYKSLYRRVWVWTALFKLEQMWTLGLQLPTRIVRLGHSLRNKRWAVFDENALMVVVVIVLLRLEICRDRHDRRSCKICASCVNFPKNNAISHIICQELKDLHTPSVILHGNC